MDLTEKSITRRGFIVTAAAAMGGAALLGHMPASMAAAAEGALLTDGTYTVEEMGHNGPLTVEVTVENGVISKIDVPQHAESPGIGTHAIDRLPMAAVENATVELDVVTGATITSMAILLGISDCIELAGGKLKDFSEPIEFEVPESQTLDADVVVIGLGLGGLCASVSAAEAGAKVIALEKQSFAGGNAVLSTGIIQAGGSSLQAAQGIEDSPEKYYEDMMALTQQRDPILVDIVTQTSGETIDWMIENGSVFNETVTQGVGSTAFRAHSGAPDAAALITGLAQTCVDTCSVYFDTSATSFITDADGNVAGVTAAGRHGEEYTINAAKVVLACGGYGNNRELMRKYNGDAADNLVYAGARATTGEMIEAALNLGAAPVEMGRFQKSPTTELTRGEVITAMVLSGGGFLLNHEGNRFTNETKSPNDYYDDIAATGDPFVYEIFNDDVRQKVHKVEAVYMKQGIVTEVANVEELAAVTGMPLENLVATFAALEEVANGGEDEFGRFLNTTYDPNSTLYFMQVGCGYATTEGGLGINENGEVLKTDGTPLGNLYGVGDTLGKYRAYGYVCGDANMLAASTGRLCGANAALEA